MLTLSLSDGIVARRQDRDLAPIQEVCDLNHVVECLLDCRNVLMFVDDVRHPPESAP
jgi:hypothetical protein